MNITKISKTKIFIKIFNQQVFKILKLWVINNKIKINLKTIALLTLKNSKKITIEWLTKNKFWTIK